VLRKAPYGVEADVFSFAIVVCEMLCGKYPYENEPESTKSFESAIVTGLLPAVSPPELVPRLLIGLRPQVPDNCPPSLRELIHRCWHEAPELRPTMAEVVTELERIGSRLAIACLGAFIGMLRQRQNNKTAFSPLSRCYPMKSVR